MTRTQLEALLGRASTSPAAIALVIIGAISTLQALAFGGLQFAQRDAMRIAIAGARERVGVVQIASLAARGAAAPAGDLRDLIAAVRADQQDVLPSRFEVLTHELPPESAAASSRINEFLGAADAFQRAPGDRAAQAAVASSAGPTLAVLDRQAAARSAAIAKRTDALIWGIGIGLAIDLAVLLMLWLLVIRPGQRRIATAYRLLQDQRRQTRSLFDINPAAIVVYDRRGRIVRGNPAALELVGGGGVRWLGRHHEAALDPSSHEDARIAFEAALAGKNSQLEVQVVNAAGVRIDVRATIFPHVVEGRIVGAIAVAEDVRALKLASAKADEGARRMMALYRIASDRRVDKYEEQIDAALRLLVQRLNLSWAALVRGDDRDREVLAIVPTPHDGMPIDILVGMETRRIPIVTNDGPPLALHLRADAPSYSRIVTDADAEFANLVASLVGTALERQSHTSKLDRLAFYDGLTGLPNRTMLELRLEEALRQRTKFALHYIDLDQFKEVNDSLGHSAGDSVLRAAADRMKECVRRIDLVARLGGDEFMVLQPIEHHADAARLAERLISRLGDPVRIEGQLYQIGASVGIALASGGGDDDPELLMRLADTALYEAKRNGRARATFGNMVLPRPHNENGDTPRSA